MLSLPVVLVVVLGLLALLGLLQVVGLLVVGVFRIRLAREQRARAAEWAAAREAALDFGFPGTLR